jgi:hypothetical protein
VPVVLVGVGPDRDQMIWTDRARSLEGLRAGPAAA